MMAKAQYESTIKDLKREIAMITTAWYDLASRLQSNLVVLQRRHDVPKSWVNRQRQMANCKLTILGETGEGCAKPWLTCVCVYSYAAEVGTSLRLRGRIVCIPPSSVFPPFSLSSIIVA